MIALAAFAHRWRRASFVGLVLTYLAAAGLAIADEGAIAFVVGGAGTIVGMPIQLLAAASPRPGIAWEGSYAEPWRAERSPGEWQEIERRRE